MRKTFRKRCAALLAAFWVLFLSLSGSFLSCRDVRAAGAASVAGKIAAYFLGSVGAVDTTTGGAISTVTGGIRDKITQAVADQLGSGIYVDSSGDYVFSGAATTALYQALYSNSNYNNMNVRVVSDFGGAFPQGGLYHGNSSYLPSDFWYLTSGTGGNGQSVLSLYDNYVVFLGIVRDSSNSNLIYSCSFIFELPSNFAYFAIADFTSNIFGIFAYDNTDSMLTLHGYGQMARYWGSSLDYHTRWTECSTSLMFGGGLNSMGGGVWSKAADYQYWGVNYTNYSPYNLYFSQSGQSYFGSNNSNGNIWNDVYQLFPFGAFWSNRSLILGRNLASANGMYNRQKSPGIQVANKFYTLPSVSQTSIENNNWENIYNNYVNNVSETYNQYITDGGTVPDGEEFDYDKLHDYMKNFCSNITTAINSGATDIESAVYSSNDWLRRIYLRLGDIYDLIGSIDTGGGGGSGGSSTDLSGVLASLSRMEGTLSNELLQMQQTYTLLGQILSAIQSLNTGGGGGSGGGRPLSLPDAEEWVDRLDDFSMDDLLASVPFEDILLDLLKSVVPFCYLASAGALIGNLAAEPVAPVFHLPLKLNNGFIDIDDEVVIDLTYLEGSAAMNVVIWIETLFFMIFLAFVMVRALNLMLDLFLKWG